MGYITEEGLKELLNYKYKPGGYTWLDTKMNYYWEWCVNLVPMWVAPNLITFIGWILVILSYANMLRYDYTFKQDIPSSAFFFAAFCIWTYMTLDAIDGKQARRTKTSSPLGQLFDHGCDSFSISFFMLAICQAVKLEKQEVFLIFIACQVTFWTANWTEYHTGVLNTKVGQFGVTEGQLSCMFIHILTGIFGQKMWQVSLAALFHIPKSFIRSLPAIAGKALGVNLGIAVVYFYAGMIILMSIYTFIKTTLSSKQKFKTSLENLGLFLLIGMEVVWSRLGIYQKYNGIILVNFGVVASTLICKMIISSVTKMKLQYFHAELVPLGISTILMIFFDVTKKGMSAEIIIFWACFGVNLILILSFLITTIEQITKFLGIYCFSIQKRVKSQ